MYRLVRQRQKIRTSGGKEIFTAIKGSGFLNDFYSTITRTIDFILPCVRQKLLKLFLEKFIASKFIPEVGSVSVLDDVAPRFFAVSHLIPLEAVATFNRIDHVVGVNRNHFPNGLHRGRTYTGTEIWNLNGFGSDSLKELDKSHAVPLP